MSATADSSASGDYRTEQFVDENHADELRRSFVARPLVAIYAGLKGPGAAFARRFIFRLLAALEGGPMRSVSMRCLMSDVHDVDIEAFSYGCFDTDRFAPGTRIGRYVSVGPNVAVYRRNHPMDRLSLHPYFYRTELGADADADVETAPLDIRSGCWLGANVIILPGCREIGRGAVVAAGAVLTRDVPAYAIVGGNPACVIRYRFSQQAIDQAEASRWWTRSPDEVWLTHNTLAPWESALGETSGSRSHA